MLIFILLTESKILTFIFYKYKKMEGILLKFKERKISLKKFINK